MCRQQEPLISTARRVDLKGFWPMFHEEGRSSDLGRSDCFFGPHANFKARSDRYFKGERGGTHATVSVRGDVSATLLGHASGILSHPARPGCSWPSIDHTPALSDSIDQPMDLITTWKSLHRYH